MAKSRRIRHRRTRRGGEFTNPDSETESTEPMVSTEPNYETQTQQTQQEQMGGKRKFKRGKTHRRGRRGGDGGADWVTRNFGGTTDAQFMNTFGNTGNGMAGNLIPTITGAPAVLANNIPQGSLALNAGPVQGGGRRRRKKGGYWAQVLQTALVPFGLFGLQNAFAKRTRKYKK